MIKTLIVDDSDLIRLRLRGVLTKAGCEIVAESSDGKTAVEIYDKIRPDLVTLDISMPEQNGLETLKQIVSLGFDAKIIIVSAMDQKALIVQALRDGANAFIIKPFQAEEIIGKIKKLFPGLKSKAG